MNAGRALTDIASQAHRRAPMVAAAALGAAATIQAAAQPLSAVPSAPANIFLVLVALATTVPVGLLWPQPRTAAVVVAGADLLTLGLGQTPTVAAFVALGVAVFRLGYLQAHVLAASLALAFLAAALAAGGELEILLAAGAPLAAWAGYARRASELLRSARSEVPLGSLLAHTARGERARISRELHDVVAHHISMIAVQAEAARLATPGLPPAGAERLLAIGDTARSALTEMRRLLGVLREDAQPVPQFQPQPGLDQLNVLLDEARDATGAGVRLIISGSPSPLNPGAELAAYRIVQEALTNARRHAPGAAVDVELRYGDGGLFVRIRDNGPGPEPMADPTQPEAAELSSHGLLGMRERAMAVGGTFRTGSAAGGGFVVEALLPARAATDAA